MKNRDKKKKPLSAKHLLFNEEFKRRGVWTQSGALRWYIFHVYEVAKNSRQYRRISCMSTTHLKWLHQCGSYIASYPVGIQGRNVKVWLHNEATLEALIGFGGDASRDMPE